MGITKNRQSEEMLRQMVLAAFPDKQSDKITELTDGMCNVAYSVQFTDKTKSILKIAAGNKSGLMTNEINMMKAEVEAMRIVRQHSAVKVAQVQYFDPSKTLCSGEYFFMEALEGESFFTIKERMPAEEQKRIHYEIGQAEKAVTSIKGEKFGLLGDIEHCFESLFDFVYYLMDNVLSDAENRQVVIGVEKEEILECLTKYRTVFDQVTEPVLVHWDMWEGNIFIKDGHISGIIDWERALWGEAFMDDRFRRHTRTQEFLRGYGKEELNEEEMCRIYWYDIFLYLTMMIEGTYRQYEDDSQYQWVKPLFEASWEKVRV
ncbi:MAG: aminoglycoside phosphotransferase family protein [Lachnospiraceae bacterium]|nr:aminoglycoside phosphotransferase family protein [Lachnospiraceae bacterium]